MAERQRLTLSVEDGTVERLRELAGGERKVGEYVSDVAARLHDSPELLQRASSPGVLESLQQDVRTMLEMIDFVMARLERIERYLESLQSGQRESNEDAQ